MYLQFYQEGPCERFNSLQLKSDEIKQFCHSTKCLHLQGVYLAIIPRARMGSESIAHEGERNNCFSKIQLVGQKYRDKTTLAS